MWRNCIHKYFNFVVLFVPIIFFVVYNILSHGLTTRAKGAEKSNESLVETPVLEKGMDIVDRIRLHITPPSPKDVPYGPSGTNHPVGDHADYHRKITQMIWKYGLARPGYFVEAGAWHEHTLDLERYLGWDGLLIEPSPPKLEQIITRERKASIANVCLTDEPHVKVNFASRKNQAANWKKKKTYLHNIHLSSDPAQHPKNKKIQNDTECFQLHSVLHAANVSTVDLLVLDAEGYEYKILDSFPFDEFPIKVIAVDIRSMPEPNYLLSEVMAGKGYRLVYDHKKYFMFLYENRAPVGAL